MGNVAHIRDEEWINGFERMLDQYTNAEVAGTVLTPVTSYPYASRAVLKKISMAFYFFANINQVFFFKDYLIYLKVRVTEKQGDIEEQKKKESFHLVLHRNEQTWTKPVSETSSRSLT